MKGKHPFFTHMWKERAAVFSLGIIGTFASVGSIFGIYANVRSGGNLGNSALYILFVPLLIFFLGALICPLFYKAWDDEKH